jgi:nucleoside 2-deoxyribosyltransferase
MTVSGLEACSLPESDDQNLIDAEEVVGTMATPQPPTTVYIAGPMFSVGDKSEQSALAAALQAAGFVCYVPQNNGIEVAAVMQLLNDPSLQEGTMLEPPVLDRCMAWVTRAVVALDVYQTIEACQCTVLNLDGRVPDEGSLVESALAWCAGHPVVPYKSSAITELDGHDNPMIAALSGWTSVPSDPASVVVAVQAAVSTSRSPAPPPPPDVQKLVDLGKVISGIRAQPPLNDTGRKAAKTTLKSLPPDQMSLLEPDASLQKMCRRVVLAIIEFSKLGPGSEATQKAIFQREIAALRDWVAQPGIRGVLVRSPLSF